MKRIVLLVMLLACVLAATAEDVTFLNNRRQWEQLPILTLMNMGGQFLDQRMMPDSALLCWSIVVNRYDENMEERDLHNCIRAYHHISDIYSGYYHNQAEAYRYLLKSKDLAEKHHYDTYMPDILMTLGNLYWRQWGLQYNQNEYSKEALTHYKSAFWKAHEVQNTQTLPRIMINLNYAACILNDLSLTAKERETFALIKIPDGTDYKFTSQAINKGVELLSKNRFEQALEVFKDASKSASNEFEGFNKTHIHLMLDELIVRIQIQKQSPDALKTILQDNELIEKEAPAFKHENYNMLSMYYRAFNNQPLADKYELLWWRATDSIAQASQSNNLNAVRFIHELDKMNEEQKALTLKQKHDRQMLWMVSGFALVALALLVMLYLSRRHIQESYRQLYNKSVALLAAEEAQHEAAAAVPTVKYGHNRLEEDTMDELLQQILNIMETSEEVYQGSFDIDRLAELLDTKKNYVSQTINAKTGKKFFQLLNEYRIREACRRMNDTEHYGNYSVEGIAHSVGYTSRSHFVRVFKEANGVPPSTYQKLAKAKSDVSAATQEKENNTDNSDNNS